MTNIPRTNGKPLEPGLPVPPVDPLSHLEHLLKVAGSVSQDASQAWADIWEELKRCAGAGSKAAPEAKQGFVPACGWPEFLERFWLLKHYIDSIQRVCRRPHA